MAFVTGVANSYADIAAALVSACTANGWTLTGSILHRGDCHITHTVFANRIEFRCGIGMSGGVLVSPNPNPTDRYRVNTLLTMVKSELTVNWPATYYIAVVEDEVYLDVNINGDAWLNGGFGISPIDGGYTGAGVWMSWAMYDNFGGNGTPGGGGSDLRWPSGDIGSQTGGAFNQPAIGLFNSNGRANSYVYHNALGTPQWSGQDPGSRSAYAYPGFRSRWGAENPAANWNNAAGLFPIQPAIPHDNNKLCIVAELKHARYFRIDNNNPGDVITFGAEKWKVYPWYRKNSSIRTPNNASNQNHSGTFAHAIRYDGV